MTIRSPDQIPGLDRRSLLVGGTASAAFGAGPRGQAAPRSRDDALRALLDQLGGARPDEAVLALESFDPANLSEGSRLDRDGALVGLRTQAALARRFPGDSPLDDPNSPLADRRASYDLLLQANVGAPMTTDAALRSARTALERATAEADGVLRTQGLTGGPVGARLRSLALDPHSLYSDDAAGRDQAVSDMNRWLEQARQQLARVVQAPPPGTKTVSVRALTAAERAAGKGGFRDLPSLDGRKPGSYVVDLGDLPARPRWSLPSVVRHELLPGHMLQMPLEAASGAHPLRLKACPAFREGWAIYAELLADEDGAYSEDPLGRLGYLQWSLFRLGRAICDLGLHTQGWSSDRAAAFLTDAIGFAPVFAPVHADIARMIKTPAVFAGQGLWTLDLVRRRAAAGVSVGFSQKRLAFHHRLLAFGAIPLALI